MTLTDDHLHHASVSTRPPNAGVVDTKHRPRARRRRWRASAALVVTWAIAIVVAVEVTTPWYVHRAALFVHLVSLLAGFGAVLVADVHGVLWLLGRRSLDQLLSVTHALHARAEHHLLQTFSRNS
jgi:hypothetical protein